MTRSLSTSSSDAIGPDDTSSKQAQILAGADAIFTEHGYEGASMSQIARRAGVSKGTLYNHFDGKAALFAAHVKQKTCQNLRMVFQPVQDNLSPRETLEGVARTIISVLTAPSNLALYRIVVSEAEHFPHLAQTLWDSGPEPGISTFATWLEDRTRKGEMNVSDPRFAAEQFFALCQTRIVIRRRLQLPVSTTPADREKIATSTADMFLKFYGIS